MYTVWVYFLSKYVHNKGWMVLFPCDMLWYGRCSGGTMSQGGA